MNVEMKPFYDDVFGILSDTIVKPLFCSEVCCSATCRSYMNTFYLIFSSNITNVFSCLEKVKRDSSLRAKSEIDRENTRF